MFWRKRAAQARSPESSWDIRVTLTLLYGQGRLSVSSLSLIDRLCDC